MIVTRVAAVATVAIGFFTVIFCAAQGGHGLGARNPGMMFFAIVAMFWAGIIVEQTFNK